MEGPPLGPGGEDITWPDQVAPRGRKASSTGKIKPQTSNLHQLRSILSHLDLRLAESNLSVSNLFSLLWAALYPFPVHVGRHLVLHPAGDFRVDFPFRPFWTELF